MVIAPEDIFWADHSTLSLLARLSRLDPPCAVTGLKIVNGGDLPEVQAAHMRPVASCGKSVISFLSLARAAHSNRLSSGRNAPPSQSFRGEPWPRISARVIELRHVNVREPIKC